MHTKLYSAGMVCVLVLALARDVEGVAACIKRRPRAQRLESRCPLPWASSENRSAALSASKAPSCDTTDSEQTEEGRARMGLRANESKDRVHLGKKQNVHNLESS